MEPVPTNESDNPVKQKVRQGIPKACSAVKQQSAEQSCLLEMQPSQDAMNKPEAQATREQQQSENSAAPESAKMQQLDSSSRSCENSSPHAHASIPNQPQCAEASSTR
jgi:hypothetical protein